MDEKSKKLAETVRGAITAWRDRLMISPEYRVAQANKALEALDMLIKELSESKEASHDASIESTEVEG